MGAVQTVGWLLLGMALAPVLVVAAIAASTTSTPTVTRRVALPVAVAGVAGGIANPLLRALPASVLRHGPAVTGMVLFAGVLLVVAVVGIVRSDRRHAAFLAEWAAYVTAENEGRPTPEAPPRFAQVARSLAHNRGVDAMRAREQQHPGARSGAWRDAGEVDVAWLFTAGTPPLCLAAAIANAAAGDIRTAVPLVLGTLLSGWLLMARAREHRQLAAARERRRLLARDCGRCESCLVAPAEARVVFADGVVFGVCASCARGALGRQERAS